MCSPKVVGLLLLVEKVDLAHWGLILASPSLPFVVDTFNLIVVQYKGLTAAFAFTSFIVVRFASW